MAADAAGSLCGIQPGEFCPSTLLELHVQVLQEGQEASVHRSGPYMSAVLPLHLVLKRKVSCTCAVRRHAVVCSEKIKQ